MDPSAKLRALGEAVNNACDADDGIRDGILMNPQACDFQPASLSCEGAMTVTAASRQNRSGRREYLVGRTQHRGELIFRGWCPEAKPRPGAGQPG